MWISVHDSVDGSKLRKLARLAGCSKGEALGVLSAVWLWGAKNADQSGRIRDSTEEDIALVALPFLSKGIDSNEFVEKMIESGWIERVDDDLYFHDWEDWQAPWYKYLREKDRDTKRRREARQAKRETEVAGPLEPPAGESAPAPAATPKEQKTAKPKKEPKPKPEKKKFAEFVTLTEDEHKQNHQGVAVVNYTDRAIPWTRIIEHKWFQFGLDDDGKEIPSTIVSKEYSAEWKPGGEPYYPIMDEANMELYRRYAELAAKEKDVIFGGRLGSYRYYDMDQVIAAALDVAERESADKGYSCFRCPHLEEPAMNPFCLKCETGDRFLNPRATK